MSSPIYIRHLHRYRRTQLSIGVVCLIAYLMFLRYSKFPDHIAWLLDSLLVSLGMVLSRFVSILLVDVFTCRATPKLIFLGLLPEPVVSIAFFAFLLFWVVCQAAFPFPDSWRPDAAFFTTRHNFATLLVGIGSGTVSVFLNGAFTAEQLSIPRIEDSTTSETAHSLAWSYWCGYLHDALPTFADRLLDTLGHDNPPAKLFIVLPRDGEADPNDEDWKAMGFKFVTQVKPVHVDRSGIKHRPFSHSIYQHSGKQYVIEYATPIRTLNLMKGQGVNVDMAATVTAFHHSLLRILKHYKDLHFEAICQFVVVDNGKVRGDAVFKAIEEAAQEAPSVV